MATANIFNFTDTWTGGGTFKAIAVDVTDTSSASDSMLLDLQVGGSRQFGVRKDGALIGGVLPVAGTGAAGAAVRLYEDTDNGTNYVGLKAPDTIASNITYTLPGTVTNGYYLQTDGSGTLSWAAGGGASAPLTLASGTITASAPALTVTQTWNSGGVTFNGVLVNVTNTASATASTLMDLQVGGVSQFAVRRDGRVTAGDGTYLTFSTGLEIRTSAGNWAGIIGSTIEVRSSTSNDREIGLDGNTLYMQSGGWIQWNNSGTDCFSGGDTSMYRIAAGIIGIRGSSSSAGGALNFLEQTAPAAPSANEVVIYAEDNGSGKTRLMARFNTGAAQQIAIEP